MLKPESARIDSTTNKLTTIAHTSLKTFARTSLPFKKKHHIRTCSFVWQKRVAQWAPGQCSSPPFARQSSWLLLFFSGAKCEGRVQGIDLIIFWWCLWRHVKNKQWPYAWDFRFNNDLFGRDVLFTYFSSKTKVKVWHRGATQSSCLKNKFHLPQKKLPGDSKVIFSGMVKMTFSKV